MWLDYYSLNRLDLVRKSFQALGIHDPSLPIMGGSKHKNKDKCKKLKIESILNHPCTKHCKWDMLLALTCCLHIWGEIFASPLYHVKNFMMQIECCSVWVGPTMVLEVNCNLRWFSCTNTIEEYAYSLLLKNRCVVCTHIQSKATFGKF